MEECSIQFEHYYTHFLCFCFHFTILYLGRRTALDQNLGQRVFIKCCAVELVFQASGIILIIIGSLQYSTYSQIGTFAGSGLSKIAIVLIAVGVTITVVSLLGHFGACMNNSPIVCCVSTIYSCDLYVTLM